MNMANLKFMYNGIKLDGELKRAHYSKGSYFNFPEGTITIYAKGYSRLPKIDGLDVENETDSQTDYFDDDKIRVVPGNKYYDLVHSAYKSQEAKKIAHHERMEAKRAAKKAAKE